MGLSKAHENVLQEINSKMSEELSVGRNTLVTATFSSVLYANPPPPSELTPAED